jgi:hypothetical protein
LYLTFIVPFRNGQQPVAAFDPTIAYACAANSNGRTGRIFESANFESALGATDALLAKPIAEQYQGMCRVCVFQSLSLLNKCHFQQLQHAQNTFSRGGNMNNAQMGMQISNLKKQISTLQSQIAQQQAIYVKQQSQQGNNTNTGIGSEFLRSPNDMSALASNFQDLALNKEHGNFGGLKGTYFWSLNSSSNKRSPCFSCRLQSPAVKYPVSLEPMEVAIVG